MVSDGVTTGKGHNPQFENCCYIFHSLLLSFSFNTDNHYTCLSHLTISVRRYHDHIIFYKRQFYLELTYTSIGLIHYHCGWSTVSCRQTFWRSSWQFYIQIYRQQKTRATKPILGFSKPPHLTWIRSSFTPPHLTWIRPSFTGIPLSFHNIPPNSNNPCLTFKKFYFTFHYVRKNTKDLDEKEHKVGSFYLMFSSMISSLKW